VADHANLCIIKSGFGANRLGGMDLRDPVLEGDALDFIFSLAMPEYAFPGNELPFLESLGELREIPPGIDAIAIWCGFRSRPCRSWVVAWVGM
jgi:hypothetical protein